MENSTSPLLDQVLRIRAEKVTQLLDIVGELGLSVMEITRHPGLVDMELEGFESSAHRLELLVHEVQDIVSSLRLVPVGQVFHRMERVARDLSHQTGKQFDVLLVGEDVEIDKAVVDQLSDPLMHLIRNSADHGLESVEERARQGKPERGKITIQAVQRGREVLITISDDGRGLDRESILNRARERGLLAKDHEPTDQEVWNCIFQSGFSTVKEITNLSGRGVGMDVVRNTIRSLHGRIEIDTQPGKGTCMTLVIPLSLAFLESLIVRTADRLYAIPIESVQEVFQPQEAEVVRSSASKETSIIRQEKAIPLRSLDGNDHDLSSGKVIVVVQTPLGMMGLKIDEVVGQQQVVMKPLSGHLKQIKGGAGCALLSSGDVAIALDVDSLFRNEGLAQSHYFD